MFVFKTLKKNKSIKQCPLDQRKLNPTQDWKLDQKFLWKYGVLDAVWYYNELDHYCFNTDLKTSFVGKCQKNKKHVRTLTTSKRIPW